MEQGDTNGAPRVVYDRIFGQALVDDGQAVLTVADVDETKLGMILIGGLQPVGGIFQLDGRGAVRADQRVFDRVGRRVLDESGPVEQQERQHAGA